MRERDGGEREWEGERKRDGGMEKERDRKRINNAFATILVKCEHLVL